MEGPAAVCRPSPNSFFASHGGNPIFRIHAISPHYIPPHFTRRGAVRDCSQPYIAAVAQASPPDP
jgi:hypothetical protein